MRRFGAPLVAIGVVAFGPCGAWIARAQPVPPPAPVASPAPAPVGNPGPPAPVSPPSGVAPAPAPPGAPAAAPTAVPTQPPIIVDPPTAGVTPGGTETLRIAQVLGTIAVSVANSAIVDASVDQATRTLTIVGKAIGSTTVTVSDSRGLTRDVPVRVAYPAGAIASGADLRLTGDPASQLFIREQAVSAAIGRATARPGATVVVGDTVNVAQPLRVDDVMSVDVPIIVAGPGYITVQGTTRVRVENFAQPRIAPQSLLVSDFPETLRANGTLFSADLTAKAAERFLYYHYNPTGQPDRRIVLKAQNSSGQPALVQFIAGVAGPESNEMEVGHLATQRFLVRRAQNEGTVVTIPGNATVTLSQQALPARSVVSALMQLHEIEGAPVHLTLVAQDVNDPVVASTVPTSSLLVGDKPHARGVYPIPEFFFDYSYDTEGPDLEIPIGQIPLANLVVGQALAGDYGVLQSVTVRIVNNDRQHTRQIALYANPRGGQATGTFVIDRVLVQAHRMAPFGHYKLRQYTVPPGSFVRTEVVTMPEGGSSYPLRLIVAPDDGSAAPGQAESPIY